METELLARPARVGALEVDLLAYRARFAGRRLQLRRRELELLAFLVAERNCVHSRTVLADAIGVARGRSVDVMLSNLRAALGVAFVRNVRGRGWILDPDELEGT